jgi:phosphatidylserine/phosphatidylglycerophosphate/cardiolipin synthase-like enzyme
MQMLMHLTASLAVIAGGGGGGDNALELVESAPIETTLDHDDLRNADVVWLEMIAAAKKSLDFGEFYCSGNLGSRLEPVVAAIEAAAARGVHVRFLADAKMAKTYPEILDRLAKAKGIEVVRWDVGAVWGGILHAKYFVVDASEVYVGSQNFDWRSLEHIVELGLRVRAPQTAAAFQAVFDSDWKLAHGAPRNDAFAGFPKPPSGPETIGAAKITPAFDPEDGVPDRAWWDLPRLVALIDGATKSIKVEVLTYKSSERELGFWGELEDPLRRAAGRGVHVELLCADWCKRKFTIEGLQSLEVLPNVDVTLVTIPEAKSGHIGYARVCHAKYCVADGVRAWLGTSNWERDYFYASRNAAIFIEGGDVPARLERFFVELRDSPYSTKVDACAHYEPPKIGD